MSRAVQIATSLYAQLLRLYPRQFRATFSEEMQYVFSMSLQDALPLGVFPVVNRILLEIGDLPVAILLAHLYERRKIMMNLLSFSIRQDVRLIRWTARAFSLLILGFYITIIALYDDFQAQLTTPFILALAVTICLLVAWRWEKVGGRLIMAGAAVLLAFLPINAVTQLDFPATLALLVSAALVAPYLLVGWLFYSVGQHTEAGMTTQPVDEEQPSVRKPFFVYAMIVVVGLALVLLLIISFVAVPPTTNIDPTPFINFMPNP